MIPLEKLLPAIDDAISERIPKSCLLEQEKALCEISEIYNVTRDKDLFVTGYWVFLREGYRNDSKKQNRNILRKG